MQTFPEQNRPSSGYTQMAQEKQRKKNQTLQQLPRSKSKESISGPKAQKKKIREAKKTSPSSNFFLSLLSSTLKETKILQKKLSSLKPPKPHLSLSLERSLWSNPDQTNLKTCMWGCVWRKKKQKFKKNPRKIYT